MSLRSKVVIESNLKPSQFGKPASSGSGSSDKTEDFEEIYESPLEKSKPLPPRLTSGLQELPRNEPEIMEFSNPSKNVSTKDSSVRNSGGSPLEEIQNSTVNLNRKSADLNPQGFYTNEGFEDRSVANDQRSSVDDGRHHQNEKLISVTENQDRVIQPLNFNNEKKQPHDKPDISFRNVVNVIKSLDVNRYATKKTIAQGMLDIALLTANASQLKYILQIGRQHEFYILMLSLICASIGLQVIQGIICVLLGSTFNINKQQDQRKANIWNNICLILMVLTVAVNAVISAFDMRDSSAVTQTNATNGAASVRLASGGR